MDGRKYLSAAQYKSGTMSLRRGIETYVCARYVINMIKVGALMNQLLKFSEKFSQEDLG